MEENNFYTAMSHLYDVYGVELKEDMFETLGMIAWEKIGNVRSRMYQIQLAPEVDTEMARTVTSNTTQGKIISNTAWYVCLPCNVNAIEAVTANFEDYQRTSSTQNFPGMSSLPIENQIEFSKYGSNSLYMSGKLINYNQIGDRLYFTEQYPAVNILYKGYHLDETGLPYLTNKEVDAIALYCAYISDFKKARQTMDANTMQVSAATKQLWEKACSAARVPKHITDNDMHTVLNAMTSWNRKSYNKTYKPIQ